MKRKTKTHWRKLCKGCASDCERTRAHALEVGHLRSSLAESEEAHGRAMSAALEGHATAEAKLAAEIVLLRAKLEKATRPPESVIDLLVLLAHIRESVGDPEGKLMQDELWMLCKRLHQRSQVIPILVHALQRALFDEPGPKVDGEIEAALAKAKEVYP